MNDLILFGFCYPTTKGRGPPISFITPDLMVFAYLIILSNLFAHKYLEVNRKMLSN